MSSGGERGGGEDTGLLQHSGSQKQSFHQTLNNAQMCTDFDSIVNTAFKPVCIGRVVGQCAVVD